MAAMALAVAACGGGGGGKEKLTLVLDWFPNADHAGIYAAQAQGYFEAEGLKVVIQVPGNPEDPPKLVAAGRADIAVSYEPDVIQARAQGIPITAVAAIVNVPLNSIQALKTSGITSPAQLAGKKVGYPGIPSNELYMQTVLRRAQVDPKSVELVNVGFDLGPALRSKRVDAIIGAYWNVEAVEAELEGFPVNVLKLEQYGVPLYDELVFIVKDDAVTKKADALRRFLHAVVKGHQSAARDPDAAIAAVAKANPEMRRDLIDRGVRLLAPLWAKAEPFGRMDEGRWSAFVDFLVENRLIEKRVPLEKLLTNELLPK
jgi:putative hydroxymethylpyrimidine transport system substrate-binding protein